MRVIAIVAVLAACGDDGSTRPEAIAIETACQLPQAVATTMELDLAYGTDPAQRFDLARPTAPGSYPLVVIVHGGGWSSGSKAEFRDLMQAVAGSGYVAASVDYRLAPAFPFPAAVQDVRCALRTLRARAATYGIDGERVVAFGASAGAHLASMLGVASDVAGLDGACAETGEVGGVDGVVSYAGPQDLRDATAYPEGTRPIIDAFVASPAEAALASPITHVDASDPPFLLIHGTIDAVVPVEQSRVMQQRLWEAGVPATRFEGVFGHGDPAPNAADGMTITCTFAAFLDAILRP